MAAEIINLDEIIPESARIQYQSKIYEIRPVSTEMYLQVLKTQDKLKNANEQVEQVEQSILLIRLCCPELPEKDLRAMPLRGLMRMTKEVERMMEEVNQGEDKPKNEDGESLGE